MVHLLLLSDVYHEILHQPYFRMRGVHHCIDGRLLLRLTDKDLKVSTPDSAHYGAIYCCRQMCFMWIASVLQCMCIIPYSSWFMHVQ